MTVQELTTEELLAVEEERRRRVVGAFLHGSAPAASGARPGPLGSLIGGTILAVVICLVLAMVILVQRDLATNQSPSRPAPAATSTPHR